MKLKELTGGVEYCQAWEVKLTLQDYFKNVLIKQIK